MFTIQEAKTQFEGCITYGPWGYSQGEKWVYKPEGFISKIIVKYSDLEVVDCIEFQSYCSKGEIQSSVFGQPISESLTHTICIDHPNEYLMSVSGTYGWFRLCKTVRSICFKTNQNVYGPFGSNSGISFSHDVKAGELIVGFHGRASVHSLYAIGVYVMPKSLAYEGKIMNELCSSMSRMAMPREAGPWGSGGGKPWDDGFFSALQQVQVFVVELNAIYALRFVYLKKDGKSLFAQTHGETDGSKVELVDLDGEDEFLTGISGFYGSVKGYNGLEAIVSICFHTNKRIHGPYGEEKGVGYVYYSSTASPGKVVGFHGKNNGFFSAIGIHMESV
ncbi:hypothetical protein L1987_53295 [Smallanthus sonchifolius]|uniref:Uncharacterized protein n=1 Tax=Smallanthus sonchifolius TaxID=185202 RepID=A0ACB9EW45_9ASTR|nr:hypothetical protein L1987_53295 [Smallanthus sonchifolius]